MTNEKRPLKLGQSNEFVITGTNLDYILEVNKKAIEINIEVEKQNEEILEAIDYFKEFHNNETQKVDILINDNKELLRLSSEMEEKIKEIDKVLFKIFILFSTIGAGTIIGTIVAIIQVFLHNK